MNHTQHLCSSLLTNCRSLKNLKQVHAYVCKTGLDTDPIIAGKLLLHSAVSVPDALDYARRLFLHFPNPDVFMHNTLIRGLAESDTPQNSLITFVEMRRRLTAPLDSFSFAFLLKAAASYRSLESGIQLHCQAIVHGLDTHLFVGTTLVSMYSECGFVAFAKKVFEEMFEPNVVAWNAVVTACFRCGDVKEAIQLFHEMEESGIRPDGIAFISILYACSHAGLIEKGYEYFYKMKDIYNIEPAIEHYGCMVDLYGRAGQLDKAYEFIIHMPVLPTAIIWRTLLGACSIHGNVKLAERVKERLSELDPNNSGDHVLLSNIYAVAGKWKDVAAVRRSMTDQRMNKTPGWSMIEVDKIMYSFVAGEVQNSITEEAYEKLKEIMLKLRVEGCYIPEVGSVLHDIEDEEKEDSVSRHSEKLAVAFGIARLCKGSIIRIVKNLRVCRDLVIDEVIRHVFGKESMAPRGFNFEELKTESKRHFMPFVLVEGEYVLVCGL
ncbi:unnamed protein product, partial [Vitis vinifera]